MRRLLSAFMLIALLASCINSDKDLYNDASGPGYADNFSNVTSIQVNIDSEYGSPVYYAVFYEFPYADGDLVKDPALTGITPINVTLNVPNDVKKLYVLGNGNLLTLDVADINLPAASTKAASSYNALDGKVVEYINGTCFPEAIYNVRGENLYKCTDLEIASTSETAEFEEAEVWLTFIGDGGFYVSGLYGRLWFYTYPSEKLKEGMTISDVTFYGLSAAEDEIIEIPYSDIEGNKNPVFYSKNEIVKGASSFKKVALGKFNKGLNIGFVFKGNASVRFSTPYLNPKIDQKVYYKEVDGSVNGVQITGYVANGFMRHFETADSNGNKFEGNVLGMDNRAPTESNYDGDYNDMMCLIESNPIALKPVDEIDEPTPAVYKSASGVYIFEDNYPERGDYDFNDVVVEYNVVDFYTSSNKAKQVAVRLLAYGCGFNNTFGFKNGSVYTPFITGIQGYKNVYSNSGEMVFGEWVSQALFGDILPYLENGNGKIIDPTTYNTGEYPYVLDIPYSNAEFKFRWCLEREPINEAYHFINRAKDWYLTPKDESKVVVR